MPSIRIEGFRLIVNTRDERGHPPHVHALKAGTSVVIGLDEQLTPRRLKEMHKRDVARARELVAENYVRLMEWWLKYNG